MTYKIPVIYQSWGIVEVEAADLESAIIQAENGGLPDNPSYIDGSFEIDHEGIPYHNRNLPADEKS